MDAIPAHLTAEEEVRPVSADGLTLIKDMARDVYQRQEKISQMEKELDAAKKQLNRLVSFDMPALMDQYETDKIGLPEYGIDLVLTNYYHANIAKDWLPEKKEAAFRYLEETGHGDLIRLVVSVSFGAGELPAALQLAEDIRDMGLQPSIAKTVPWTTLTAWVKEQVEKRHHVPELETIGATVGKVVKRKER